MAGDHYQKLYGIPGALYQRGCPVLIESGRIFRDTETGRLLVRLKIRNLGKKAVVSCGVSILGIGSDGRRTEKTESILYSGTAARRGTAFGTGTLIRLSADSTRKIEPAVTEIEFEDGTVWEADSTVWKPVPEREDISELSQDSKAV